ncbi:biotin transporter BioY [Phaeovulum sp.]|uniref:biotin transporter BioY n=1 Tax=Phaeovulum sp. TaxID=2934796 RepID=UPI0039E37142
MTQVLMVLGGSLFVGLSAQVSVPMLPVPMTLQTLAITIVGLTYGSRLAAATLIAYLAEGAMGLPVFAGGAAGAGVLMGPTAGFLWGFVGMAWLTGFMAERGFSRGLGKLFIAGFVPGMALFVPGVLVLKTVTGLDLSMATAAGVTPFLLGTLVKAALAAVAVSGGWAALKSRKG